MGVLVVVTGQEPQVQLQAQVEQQRQAATQVIQGFLTENPVSFDVALIAKQVPVRAIAQAVFLDSRQVDRTVIDGLLRMEIDQAKPCDTRTLGYLNRTIDALFYYIADQVNRDPGEEARNTGDAVAVLRIICAVVDDDWELPPAETMDPAQYFIIAPMERMQYAVDNNPYVLAMYGDYVADLRQAKVANSQFSPMRSAIIKRLATKAQDVYRILLEKYPISFPDFCSAKFNAKELDWITRGEKGNQEEKRP